MIADRWGLFLTPDQQRHLVFLHEAKRHRFHRHCACRTRIVNGIIVHAIITPVVVEPQRREREH